MPGLDRILDYFAGVVLLMSGRREGLRRLDLSADGFWESFAAIVVALPPVALSWVEFEIMEKADDVSARGPYLVYGAHALADLMAWIVPVLVAVLIARLIGYERKVVPLVVATNWAGALFAWALAPLWLILLFAGGGPVTAVIGALASIASIVLTVRLIFVALGQDLAGAVGFTVLMIVGALVSYGAVMDLTGVELI